MKKEEGPSNSFRGTTEGVFVAALAATEGALLGVTLKAILAEATGISALLRVEFPLLSRA